MANVIVDLATSLVQTFTIVFLGYVFGRMQIVTKAQADGIGIFTSALSLPALLFRSMAILDFDKIHWSFLWGILIAKSLVFALAIVGTLVLDHKHLNNVLGNAGLRAIFVTQSNDFALGLPIIEFVFKSTHPSYIDLVYLAAPISLVLLNPIGFFMLSYSTGDRRSQNMAVRLRQIFVKLISNPLVSMSFFGIVTNFATGNTLPSVLDDLLLMLGNAYSPAALFLLGHTMVGKMTGLKIQSMLLPTVLSMTKVLILPIIAYQAISLLGGSCDLMIFGFIYASIPTTPSVLLYAQQYGVNVKHTTIGMVLCTIIGAPMMLIGAQVANMTSDSSYDDVAEKEMLGLTIPGAIGATWVCILFWFSDLFPGRKYECLFWAIFCQSITSITSLMCGASHTPGFEIVRLGIMSTTQFAAYIWITCACMETACRVLVLDSIQATHRTPLTSVDLDGQTLATARKAFSPSVMLLTRWASVPHTTRFLVYHWVAWLASLVLAMAGALEWSNLPWDGACWYNFGTQHAIALFVSVVSGTLIVMSLTALKWAPDRSNIFRGTLVDAAKQGYALRNDASLSEQNPSVMSALLADQHLPSDACTTLADLPGATGFDDDEQEMESIDDATMASFEADSQLETDSVNRELLAVTLDVGAVKLGNRTGYRLLVMALYQLATFIVVGAMDILSLFYISTKQNRSENGILLFLCIAMVSFQGVLTALLYGFSINRVAKARLERWKKRLSELFA